MPRARMLWLLIPFGLIAICGCASRPTLTLAPQRGNLTYAKSFQQAFCQETDDGEYNCVLISNDAAGSSQRGSIGPNQHLPLRQVVHIRVMWRPMSGTRGSLAANAAIDWYVMPNTASSDDLLLYQGSGFVMVSPGGRKMRFIIRSGSLQPSIVRGLTDPIGPAGITGDFVATIDPDLVSQTLASVRQRVTAPAAGQ